MMWRCCCPGLTTSKFRGRAGPGSGARRKDSVHRAASVLMARAAERAGSAGSYRSPRWLLGEPPQPCRDEVWAAYITAKTAAEADLRARDLDWTILRPGDLTDDPATPAGSGSHTRRSPAARFPAPTSPQSSLPRPRTGYPAQDA